MTYRYYVHDRNLNVGVTEYGTEIPNMFADNLADCVEWFMYEADNTIDYEIYVHLGEEKILITFSDDQYADFFKDRKQRSVARDSVRDYIKSTM